MIDINLFEATGRAQMLTFEVGKSVPVVDRISNEDPLDKSQIENTNNTVETHVSRVDGLEQDFVGVQARIKVGRNAGLLELTVPLEDQIVVNERVGLRR